MQSAIKVISASLVLFIALLCKIPAGVKFHGYGTVREFIKVYTMLKDWRSEEIYSEHFRVRFMPGNRAEAELVLEATEFFYYPVMKDFNYSPRTRIPVIIYSSREALNKSFGWDAKENAMGVYWAGTIRVLSPRAWAGGADMDKLKETFFSSGPVAHELTHLVVDYLTGGNYPRWFTEGVAQYEEYKLTGFVFRNTADLLRQSHYSIGELDDFDNLPNQAQAYSESFSAVLYIVQNYGEDTLMELFNKLGEGNNFSEAMEKAMGINVQEFDLKWQEWCAYSLCN
ncbi:MAG: hypothetical protein A4E53_04274 [Pelotomaculum sp. PtaB.Bin104]|nr:MAG: hypothetical protein A4E53_04274 [Pelotomaculum sp. PtaB.Bin104]